MEWAPFFFYIFGPIHNEWHTYAADRLQCIRLGGSGPNCNWIYSPTILQLMSTFRSRLLLILAWAFVWRTCEIDKKWPFILNVLIVWRTCEIAIAYRNNLANCRHNVIIVKLSNMTGHLHSSISSLLCKAERFTLIRFICIYSISVFLYWLLQKFTMQATPSVRLIFGSLMSVLTCFCRGHPRIKAWPSSSDVRPFEVDKVYPWAYL